MPLKGHPFSPQHPHLWAGQCIEGRKKNHTSHINEIKECEFVKNWIETHGILSQQKDNGLYPKSEGGGEESNQTETSTMIIFKGIPFDKNVTS